MIITPPNIVSRHVKAFFTTREFNGSYDHMSNAVAHELNIPAGKIYLPVQMHTNRIQVLVADTTPEVADAVITKRKEIYVGVLVADCVPILLYDKEQEVIGAVHAGWRGTAQRILKETIMTMQERLFSLPENIYIAIGPSIRKCSYEVDKEVKDAVEHATGHGDYYSSSGDKYYIDLSSANRIQALSTGIPADNVWQSEDCTFCNPHKYYSYRHSGGGTGRQGGFIGMW
ncbi:MAG: peptidoglycan editing factor PgeF [Nitrospirae bacterium]|nr:peptidoglycan editing factor PgeF [Nitrospirota bacterium]